MVCILNKNKQMQHLGYVQGFCAYKIFKFIVMALKFAWITKECLFQINPEAFIWNANVIFYGLCLKQEQMICQCGKKISFFL